MADLYANFAELQANETYGIDYSITVQEHPTSDITVFTPHGGGIEVGTSEAVIASAKDIANLYLFEGLNSSNNDTLHITSANFDEPQAVQLITSKARAISLHGYYDPDNQTILLGGLDTEWRDIFKKKFTRAGFNTVIANSTTGYQGIEPTNIVNRCSSGAGVQLELSTALRKSFFQNGDWSIANRINTTKTFDKFIQVIRSVIY
ncbi:poly-gamma-glutamate hydrolase family protein [Peribacillus sp. CSMR9]|uniref:poly-gamma-glutamate hydrolase family protein n=1 Tax=Peribacillus sp. CSMR9 TaxID=2981350 RepID=UPI0029558CAD|nr:poly-gamma-glutamate hydrolase family protein [Peribacillus sp. CSMR9]MDV7767280.1 poly-gamma-glutamate hydrolase family protein [Peribacillus sp. CSMR9]